MQTKSITSHIKEMRKSYIRMRPRTVLKLREEELIRKEPAMVHKPTTSLPNGSNEFNMKQLAQELAPFVASAM